MESSSSSLMLGGAGLRLRWSFALLVSLLAFPAPHATAFVVGGGGIVSHHGGSARRGVGPSLLKLKGSAVPPPATQDSANIYVVVEGLCDDEQCMVDYEMKEDGEVVLLGVPIVISSEVQEVIEPFNPVIVNDQSGKVSLDGQKTLNLMVLLLAGAWLLHSILTVDASISRGWTWQEAMLRVPYDNWGQYEEALYNSPLLTKTALNGGIYAIGDWMAQVQWGKKELTDFDLVRVARNSFIGCLFGPVVHYYYGFSDWILPVDVASNRPLKILMDQTIYVGAKTVVYWYLQGGLSGRPLGEIWGDVQVKLPSVMKTSWKFWPIVHCCTYGFIPPRHRVLWVNCVDLIWQSILAQMVNTPPPPQNGKDDGKATSSSTASK
jgi:protein Mpv17